MEQLRAKRVEREEEEQRKDEERRAFDETTRRWEERRNKITRQVASEYERTDQSQVQRAYAPSIAALNAAHTTNQLLLVGFPMQTSVFCPSIVVPNLMLPDSAGLNQATLVGTQPLAVFNLAVTQPQNTMAV